MFLISPGTKEGERVPLKWTTPPLSEDKGLVFIIDFLLFLFKMLIPNSAHYDSLQPSLYFQIVANRHDWLSG